MGTLTLAAVFTLVSTTYDLPKGLLSATCFVESGHRIQVVNHKDGGSRSNGVCQMKLATAKYLGFQGTEKELMKPEVNVYWAGLYLQRQLKRYDGDVRHAVAAYNAGSLRLDDKGNIRNQKYVTKVYMAWSEGR